MYTSMYLTELGVKRRIWVYLPRSYSYSEKRYPVLYMQDGQNLFNPKESFSGAWEIDQFLDSQEDAGIVIGIDNGGSKRINEYNPNNHDEYGEGLGREYLRRVVTILKPFIDERFRTLPGPEDTAIAGSSMGGLISFYGGLFHPETFGAIGVLSPSFWLVPDLESDILKFDKPTHHSQRYYFYAGGRESDDLVERVSHVHSVVQSHFQCESKLHIREKGLHSEITWNKIFPGFYRWLME
ncbi:MAG: alpha/beta hydrolase-fold protein [Chitinophagaceae bacterium]|nr:alpha/beta hydrolase-fold protein [Chitinophagaceae bacterium]